MNSAAYDWIGWIATALFSASYFLKSQRQVFLIQAAAASAWLAFGILMKSTPVIVANFIVITSALFSAWRLKTKKLYHDEMIKN